MAEQYTPNKQEVGEEIKRENKTLQKRMKITTQYIKTHGISQCKRKVILRAKKLKKHQMISNNTSQKD